MDSQTLVYGIAAVPSIVGLVQVLKEMGLPGQYAPGASVLLGVLAGVGQVFASAGGTNATIAQAVVTGIALGLSASGLYSGTTAVVSKLTAGSDSSPAADPAPAPVQPAPAAPAPSTPAPAATGTPITAVVTAPVPAGVPPAQPAQPVAQ